MINDRELLEQARSRLAQNALLKRRAGSVIGLVEALQSEIGEARARGKTWRDITRDIAGNDSLKPDAVRLGYRRLQAMAGAERREPNRKRAQQAHAVAQPVAGIIQSPPPRFDAGLFAPMFDAQDTRRRSNGEGQP